MANDRFSIKPFEQVLAELVTVGVIHVGASGPADVLKRAQTAQNVAGILQQIANGDIGDAQAALAALVAGPGTDPGLAQVIRDLMNVSNTVFAIQAGILTATPLLGAAAQGIMQQIATGMATVAADYVAQATAQLKASSK